MPKGLKYELKSKMSDADQDGSAVVSIAEAAYTATQIRQMIGDLTILARKIENDPEAQHFPDAGDDTW